MKERPILFSGPMVRAILENRKTQTRRVNGLNDVNRQPDIWTVHNVDAQDYMIKPRFKGRFGASFHTERLQPNTLHICPQLCPYGQPGDRLWVRETTQADHESNETLVFGKYSADGSPILYPEKGHEDDGYAGSLAHWWYSKDGCPSIHMPRWASRILLEVVSVRVEQLQDISERDARAEGLEYKLGFMPQYRGAPDLPWRSEFPRDAYCDLWESINGKGSWSANPWVWVVEFKVVNNG